MIEEMKKMMEYLPQLTKDEANLIEHALTWPDEYRAAFLLAKKIFEEEDED
jgi:hypothetical protein